MFAKIVFIPILVVFYCRYGLAQSRCVEIFSQTEIKSQKYVPHEFVNDQVRRLKVLLIRDGYSVRLARLKPKIISKRSTFFRYLYEKQIVSSHRAIFLLSDKLLFWRLIQSELGSRAEYFHPFSMGLKEFLVKIEMVQPNGELINNKERLLEELNKMFPKGFVLKPLMGFSSNGNGIISNPERLLRELYKDQSPYWSKEEISSPSTVMDARLGIGRITSGERFLLQEKVGETILDYSLSKMYDHSNEYRVHSYGRHVIPGAISARWYGPNDSRLVSVAEKFIEDFLREMPGIFFLRKAFSFDVYVTHNSAAIIELNTNFGQRGGWSGFSSEPNILGAYVRFFEKQFGWNFGNDIHATLLRSDLGNIKVYAKNELHYARQLFLKNEDPALIDSGLRTLVERIESFMEATKEHREMFVEEREFLKIVLSNIKKMNIADQASLTIFFDWVSLIP